LNKYGWNRVRTPGSNGIYGTLMGEEFLGVYSERQREGIIFRDLHSEAEEGDVWQGYTHRSKGRRY
jgi:hypothetical protein